MEKDNSKRRVTIEERPTQCALCPCKSGNHAMHPLYDKHKEGQPLVKGNTTIWVHTLCALFLCSYELTHGLVYGCNEIGDFDIRNEMVEEHQDDTANTLADPNYYFRYFEGEEEVLTASPHHFVIASSVNGASATELQILKDSRGLKCFECHNPDNRSKRIAVQVRRYCLIKCT